jgi:hypothetical protein
MYTPSKVAQFDDDDSVSVVNVAYTALMLAFDSAASIVAPSAPVITNE